jgi:hypothetical protein
MKGEDQMFNLVALAGGAKNIADPASPRDRAHVFFSLEKLGNGKPTVVSCIDYRFWEAFLAAAGEFSRKGTPLLVTTHTDCGAYGGSRKFPDKSAERQFHEDQLAKAVQLVEARLGEAGGSSVTGMFVDDSFNRSRGAHVCDGLVFACAEAQAWPRAFAAARSDLGIETFDILTTFGGAARMAGEEANFSEHLLRNIAISRDLHGIKRVVVVGHAGGACGVTREDGERAARFIKEKFPALDVQEIWTDGAK